MKVYIFADMEGISGISGGDFVNTDGLFYAAGRKYYTQDVNACVRGCLEGGADSVLVRDGHGGGNHLLWEELDPPVEIIQGGSGASRLPGIQECAGLILLGYHAMAGTFGALLEHTYSSAGIQNMWLNGRRVGEVGLDAAVAADYGVPTILVTGDDHVCREAAEWIPGVITCRVKTGLSCQGARLLPRQEAHRLIQGAAADAVRKIGSIKPMKVERPVTIRTEVIERGSIPCELARPQVRIIDGRTFEATADTVEKALYSAL